MDEHELPADTVVIEPPPTHPTDASAAVVEFWAEADKHGLTPEDFPEEEG